MGWVLSRITGGRPTAIFERLFPSQHIQYFTRSSFATLAHECGFEVVQLDLRSLPFTDLAISLPIRLALTGVQLFDLPSIDALRAEKENKIRPIIT